MAIGVAESLDRRPRMPSVTNRVVLTGNQSRWPRSRRKKPGNWHLRRCGPNSLAVSTVTSASHFYKRDRSKGGNVDTQTRRSAAR
jgi:hypothetical protein